MAFEITYPIDGAHGLDGGPAQDGVWFGSLGSAVLPVGIISRVFTGTPASQVFVIDANGTTTATDETADASSVAANDIAWPSGASPTDDAITLGVPAGKTLKGVLFWLTTNAQWTEGPGLAWRIDYPSNGAMVSAPVDATAPSPSVLRTQAAPSLVYVELDQLLQTDSISSIPIPAGGSSTFYRPIRIRIDGISALTQSPLFGRVWPIYDAAEADAYADYTTIIQPMVAPNFSGWPTQIVARQNDVTLFVFNEWPVITRMIIDTPSGTSGANTMMYWGANGLTAFPANYVNDPSNFGRAAVGTYSSRWAKPADATKVWVLTYTLSGDTHTRVSTDEPALPSGAVQVRKFQGHAIGRRYDVSTNNIVNAFRMSIEGRLLDSSTMVPHSSIRDEASLKKARISTGVVTNVSEPSTYQVVNTRTESGPVLTGTLNATSSSLTNTTEFARQANDGFLLVQILGKATAGAESEAGYLEIDG